MEKKERIIVIDVRNDQKSYSALDALICKTEKEEKCEEINYYNEIRVNLLNQDKDLISPFFYDKNFFVDKVEGIVSQRERNIFLQPIYNDNELECELKNEEKLIYYIRINSENEDDVVSLQYLVLLLQGWEVIHNRMICFFVPSNDYYIKNTHTDEEKSKYHKYSHYLRLVSHSLFWSAFFKEKKKDDINNNQVVFAPLSKKKTGVQSTFLPLLEINEKTYKLLSATFKSNEIIKSELLVCVEIADKIANKKHLSEDTINSIKEKEISVLQYLLLCTIFPEDILEETANRLLDLYLVSSSEFSDGIFQLLENIIRYSQFHKGVFSFRIHSNDSDYIKSELGINNQNENFYSQKVRSFLEVGVADYNNKENILDNFFSKESVQKETIYEYRGKAEIKNLFREDGEDENLNLAWKEYQKSNRLHGMGLPRMKENVEENNALLFAKSSILHKVESERLYLYNDYFRFERNNQKKYYERYYLPGTQYRIVFPLFEKEEKNMVYNSDIFAPIIGNLKEDEEALAEYFYYKAEQLKTSVSIKDFIDILSEEYYKDYLFGKDSCVEKWINLLDESYTKKLNDGKTIYFFDALELSNSGLFWAIETFCKGIIGSLLLSRDGIKYFSIINCSRLLMTMFLKTYYFIGDIENYTHIYLSGRDIDEELYLVGHNREQIEKNLIQYAFPRRRLDFEKIVKKDGAKLEVQEHINVVPFDVIISRQGLDSESNDKTTKKRLFDEYIETIGERELTNTNGAGYKISDTHMRLGSKIHLDSFYEIAILFQKPRIARKIAYKVLRQLCEDYYQKDELPLIEGERKIWDESILFYGYSSYTRIILESLIELAKKVSRRSDLRWAFAIYQNDIVVEKRNNCVSSIDNIFYSKDSLRNQSELEKYNIVQIVPISTSLTTFKKMKGKMEDVISAGGSYKCIEEKIRANYTFFWVRNVQNDINQDETLPTELESSYWSRIDNHNSIVTKLIKPNPIFFSSVRSCWHDPLTCDKCYPENLLDERVLTETDVTSTIPSVQLERNCINIKIFNEYENEKRILKLKNSLRYGHIYRENNHFQYYFDTNELFLSQKDEIEKWLVGLRNESNKKTLNIIVTPLHHTNAGFCQCVNNAVFNGSADIISFDAAREYKSNVEAKYADVKETIRRANELKIQTRFIFVDDTIISGTAFRRINNLIHVLVDEEDRKPIQIDEVFVLLNRMSESSQNNYVLKPNDSFHAFVNLSISSVRNHGTSCIMCGMRREAESFFRRSSTKSMSEYWNRKLYEYREESFDEFDKNGEKVNEGYFRMLCSHIAGDVYKYSSDREQIFNEIIGFFENLNDKKTSSPIYEVLKNEKRNAIQAFLKILVRPFFSFGKSYRQCIHDFFMFLTECFINPEFEKKITESNRKDVIVCCTKKILNDTNIQKRLLKVYRFIQKEFKKQDLGSFVIDYLIEGLTDIRSNYVIRRNTLINLCRFIGKLNYNDSERELLFEKIRINIHRLINVSSDETKTLWLEYLLATGNEYPKNKNDFYKNIKRADCLLDLPNDIENDIKKSFQSFWEDLYIDNIRLYYDGTKHILDRMTDEEKSKGDVERIIDLLSDDYYFVNYKKLINLHYNVMKYDGISDNNCEMSREEQNRQIQILVEFLLCLNNARKEGQKNLTNIQDRYNKLYKVLKDLVWADNGINDRRVLDIVVESESDDFSEPDYYSLEENKTNIPHSIRLNVEKAKNDLHFKKTGYYISETSDYVVISIQNNYEFLTNYYDTEKDIKNLSIQESRIAPVYIYVKMENKVEKHILLEVIRRVLMFKHQLLHLFEQDFNNNAIDDLMRNKIRNEQLARDNAGDHSKASDLTSIMRILQSAPNENTSGDVGYWFLLRTYVNMRIGRLFRRMMNDKKEYSRIYVDKESASIDVVDFWNLPFVDFGKSITNNISDYYCNLESDEKLNISPRYYFSRLENAFVINFEADGKKEEEISFNMLFEKFSAYEGVEGDKGYYRSEFIICILLDILFSAINNSKEWKKLIKYPTNEWMMMDQFELLKTEKCKVDICIENTNEKIEYLSIKNEKILREDESLEEINHCMNDLINGGNPTQGLSLWTIKQYIEGIWDKESPLKVDYHLEDEKNGKYTFVTRLPIIVRKEHKDE